MAHDLEKPLLRLNSPKHTARRPSGGGGSQTRQFSTATQSGAHGPVFRQLRSVLDRQDAALQLRADPSSLAPERLLVFEVTGSVQNFVSAVSKIMGLEFAGEEEIAGDDLDESPEFYLLVPQLGALKQIVSLWERWERGEDLPRGYAPWRDLFLQLRKVRPWGPADRITPQNREYFLSITDGAPDNEPVRIEIELVFRPGPEASRLAENEISTMVVESGGHVISRSRQQAFAYHAVLADVPAAEIRRIANLDRNSLAGADRISAIVPQSVGTHIAATDSLDVGAAPVLPGDSPPIAAVFDAVPMQAHPLLTGRLLLDDPTDLEARAVGQRIHGTAMASLAVHGDLNSPSSPISRRVYFYPVMYAPAFGDEIFDNDRLIIDVIVEAVLRMRSNVGAQVVVVNLSLGDKTKPFSGKISTWARAIDYLAFRYGILFLVSAGNAGDSLTIVDYADQSAFHEANSFERAGAVFRALNAVKAERRLLAPADSVNALTIGSWHRDACQETFPGTSPFSPYADHEMPNVSSRLGSGLRRATKPEALFAGGRQPVRFDPVATPSLILRSHPLPSRYWGMRVAAPPVEGVVGTHFTMGTSAATALATHTAHRIFDALENAYPQLIAPMPLTERAVLLKALLVHSASWRDTEQFIRSIIDPAETIHHETWRREVCRYLGYGFVDPDDAIACTADRATMWATGTLPGQGSLTFDIPVPATLAASADAREIRATLAWFTPIRPGHLAYRAVKLKIDSLEQNSRQTAGVNTTSSQPTNSQSESGTIIHRRWRDARIGNAPTGSTVPIQIQREKDQGTPIDEAIPFGLAVTIEMPGAVQVYNEVRANINIKPRITVRVPG
ncbi:S8 family peptidase [Nitrospirillum iridis]|uniref:Peptidase S8/S53 domain-containing protein n=1 Tax=Nitrospirillum iridis TaxID=765888 RepID=A0A7X0ATQ9_9PROT|nr:S8 family peptidase [Nitrospirillum iridis]MBB6249527.1 hypothetical protein [Nitrospirillum iridis]